MKSPVIFILTILISSYLGITSLSPSPYHQYAQAAMHLYIITGSTDKSEYKIGDTVNISGTVANYDNPQQPVVIQVSNPRLDLFRYDKVMLNSNGAYTDSFKLEGDKAILGTYQIVLSYFGSKIVIFISVIEASPIERISITNTSFHDPSGAALDNVSVGKQVTVRSNLENTQDGSQEFAYIVQIKDSNDIVVQLAWSEGTLGPKETFGPSQSWVPEKADKYTVQIFVWQSISKPMPLSPVTQIALEVSP